MVSAGDLLLAQLDAWLTHCDEDPHDPNAFVFNGKWYLPLPIGEAKILGRFPTTSTTTVCQSTSILGCLSTRSCMILDARS